MTDRRTWPERLYAAALRALPREQRQSWGGEMRATFAALLSARRGEGVGSVAAFVLRSVLDVLRLGVGERLAGVRGRVPRIGRPWLEVREGGDAEGSGLTRGVAGDLRLALRRFLRSPSASTVLVLTVGLAIGASTAVFSVLHGVLLRPLPFPEAEELVLAWHTSASDPARRGISGPDLLDYRGADGLEGLAGVTAMSTTMSGGPGPRRVGIAWVTPDLFRLLGVEAAIGRTLRPSDERATDRAVITRPGFDPPPVPVVLSHALWVERFGSEPQVVGRTVRVNGQPMAIVGVLPQGFRLDLPVDGLSPDGVHLWTPMPIALEDSGRGEGGLTVVGRLTGVDALDEARAALRARAAALRADHAVHASAGTELHLSPLHEEVVGPVRARLWLLFGAVGLVLAAACANVAALLLVRALAREREWAVLRALGSGRGRIVRQLLAESLLLSLPGMAAGLALAFLGVDLLLALRPAGLPRVDQVGLDAEVLAFSAALCALCAVVFAVVPALVAARSPVPLAGAMPAAGGAGRRGGARLRGALIVAELAISVVLLAAAGLMLRTFVALQAEEPGFSAEGVTVAHVSLPFFEYRDRARRVDFYERVLRGLRDAPAVEAVGGSVAAPLGSAMDGFTSGFAVSEEDAARWQENRLDYRPVLPGYLEAVGARLVAGRGLTLDDAAEGAPLVVVVDEVLARRAWGDADPLGERLLVSVGGEMGDAAAEWAEVVGVVAHVRDRRLDRDGRGAVYLPFSHYAWFEMALLVRGPLDAARAGEAVRAAVAEADVDVPVHDVRPLHANVADALAPTRFALTLLGAFALVTLVLAAVGVYGLVAAAVQQRTTEIGVRIALGADGAEVVRMIGRRALRLTATGLLIGLAVALAGRGLLAGFLHGVHAADPLTYLATAALLGLVAAIASLVPARRATRVDPVVALRPD